MGRKRGIIAGFLSLLVIIALFGGICMSIWMYGTIDAKQEADVILVLGSATTGDVPTPAFQERIDHGIWLYQNGYAPYILFSGGKGSAEQPTEAMIAKNYALSQGIPENAIILEEQSTSTEENMKFSKVVMEEHSFETAIIVSDPLHLKRAMLMASDNGITGFPSPTPTTVFKSFGSKLAFVLREGALYAYYRIIRLFR